MRRYFRFEVNNLEYIQELPEGVPVIYCFNHRSHLDTFIFASALVYPFGNRTACGLMTSGKAMEEKVFGLLRYLGAFPVYSQNPKPALDYVNKLLNENFAVLIAPQGKRIPSNPIEDYHYLDRNPKSGVGRVILNNNGRIPVVPAYIKGSQEALAGGNIIPKMNSYISVSFCKPLLFTEYQKEEGWTDSDPDYYTTAHKISKHIMTSIKDQMLFQERYFFQIIKEKLNIPLEKIKISPDTHFKTYQLISKLLHYSPAELRQLINSKQV
jgi:1-acyl-sn-glycerol-3-phosphate acyltransferase